MAERARGMERESEWGKGVREEGEGEGKGERCEREQACCSPDAGPPTSVGSPGDRWGSMATTGRH